jgi:hypothetical protein
MTIERGLRLAAGIVVLAALPCHSGSVPTGFCSPPLREQICSSPLSQTGAPWYGFWGNSVFTRVPLR